MNITYNPGDKVVVRGCWPEDEDDDSCAQVIDMDPFLGKIVTIDYRIPDQIWEGQATYRILEDEGMFFWPEACFIDLANTPGPQKLSLTLEDL